MADNLSRLAGAKVFSSLDSCGAFHCVPVRKDHRYKTSFVSPLGSYQFKRMPFGLCNAPATYCRLISQVLETVPCLLYTSPSPRD